MGFFIIFESEYGLFVGAKPSYKDIFIILVFFFLAFFHKNIENIFIKLWLASSFLIKKMWGKKRENLFNSSIVCSYIKL
jgi:hypothetical protein